MVLGAARSRRELSGLQGGKGLAERAKDVLLAFDTRYAYEHSD